MLRIGANDVRFDSRVCRVGEALSKDNVVWLLDTGGDQVPERERIGDMQVERLRLVLRRLPHSALFWPLRYLEYLARASWRVWRFAPEVVHCHDLDTLVVGAVMRALRGSRVVYDSHELYPDLDGMNGPVRWFWRSLEGLLVNRVDHVVTANQTRAGVMRERYRMRTEPTPIMNCPTERPEPSPRGDEVAAPGAPRIVLYQGGLVGGRGLEELVRAMELLPPDVELVFMGSGSLKDTLLRVAREVGVDSRVSVRDPVPYAELLEHTAQASVGIVSYQPTSLNKYYCAPNKLFEYCQAGIPVAASDLPELAAFVEEHRIGAVFDPYDPRSMAAAIARVLGGGTEWQPGVRTVARNFTWERERAKLLTIYDGLRERGVA